MVLIGSITGAVLCNGLCKRSGAGLSHKCRTWKQCSHRMPNHFWRAHRISCSTPVNSRSGSLPTGAPNRRSQRRSLPVCVSTLNTESVHVICVGLWCQRYRQSIGSLTDTSVVTIDCHLNPFPMVLCFGSNSDRNRRQWARLWSQSSDRSLPETVVRTFSRLFVIQIIRSFRWLY